MGGRKRNVFTVAIYTGNSRQRDAGKTARQTLKRCAVDNF
jgi:hypothetical protein